MARDFAELDAWRLADELRQLTFVITGRPHAARDLKFCDQIRRSARSAPNNIAEGFGRFQHKDMARFLRIAVGSLNETRDHLIDGHRRGFVTDEEHNKGTLLARRSARATSGLIRYLMNSDDPEP